MRWSNSMWRFMICRDSPTYQWVDEWVVGWGHVISLKIKTNLNLIEIIQFCLNIYDLWRHSLLYVGMWMGWWMGHSFNILTFDFLLKPPQPITGLFYSLVPLVNLLTLHKFMWWIDSVNISLSVDALTKCIHWIFSEYNIWHNVRCLESHHTVLHGWRSHNWGCPVTLKV